MSETSPPPVGVGALDWAETPQAVRTLVLALQRQVLVQHEQIGRLSERMAAMEERTRRSSRNSSQPPSTDPPSAPARPKRQRSGRKQGGQPGHEGHGRALLPPEQVDQVVDAKPTACGHCGQRLLGEDAQPTRHQVADLPRVLPAVTEYRRHTLVCVACGATTTADWPAAMPPGSFGPRVAATVAYLTGRCGVSQREAQEILGTVCHLAVGLGSIAALEAQVSAALAAPMAEAQTAVREQPVANVDETSWREQTQRCWRWVAVRALVTVFLVRPSRGSTSAKELLGAAFAGIVGSDRWSGYTWLATQQRQVCWAHLVRDFTALVARGGGSKALGTACLDVADRLFALWYRVRDGTLDRATFLLLVVPLQAELHALLTTGLTVPQAKTRQLCKNLLKVEAALWTFVTVSGVEPTNNSAERALRRAVLWRRRSFGTQSAAGSRFVARVLTAVATLRQQERDVLDYLAEATHAALIGAPLPSLLPPAPAPSAVLPATLPLAA
ncbi:MAG TPA: IS66 family transposase [Chloroflexota bacterium]|nr:IS66 family transposase [Chloroflexota bacterium]